MTDTNTIEVTAHITKDEYIERQGKEIVGLKDTITKLKKDVSDKNESYNSASRKRSDLEKERTEVHSMLDGLAVRKQVDPDTCFGDDLSLVARIGLLINKLKK